MAVIAEPRFRATDASGNAYAGATLTVYTAGTTTPASIYRNASLTTPMTNPSSVSQDKSDANGWFPEVFAVENQTFDVLIKDSSGNVLSSLISVPSVGSSSSNITKDFGTGGRLTFTGSSASILIQAGPPVGDDTGGSLVLEGYGGTQLDSLILDSAVIDTTGKYTENAKDLQGVVYIGKTDFSGTTGVPVPLTNSPAGVRAWDVDFFNVTISTGGVFSLTASTDNGSTYLSTGYTATILNTYATTVASGASATSKWELNLSASNSNGSTPANLIRVRVHQPTDASNIMVAIDLFSRTGASVPLIGRTVGFVPASARVTHLKLFYDGGGTLAGSYRVVPLRGFN